MISAADIYDFKGSSLRKTCTFVFLFFAFLGNVFGQDGVTISSNGDEGSVFTQQQTIPLSFEFDEPISGFEETDINTSNGTLSDFFVEWPEFGYEKNLGRLREFRIKIEDNPNTESSENAIIAIDFNTSGRIYALTLDNGVIEFDSDGTPTNPNFILQDELNEPRDIAIYNDKLYIAESGENRIVVYNLSNDSVTYLGEEDLDTPSGLAIDDNGNIYIADTGNNRVVIYSSTGTYLDEVRGDGAQSLTSPIRLDVDSNQNIFVNDIGNNRIQIFDNSGDYISTISNANGDDLNTPGSIIVDDYGFIYIADLGEVDLGLFLNIDEIEPLELLPLASSDFRIQIFRFDDLSEPAKSIEDNNLNIPVDLAFKPCGYLAVNNSDASLKFNSSGTFVEIIFDAKIYNRLPTTFTANLEIEEECLAAEVSIDANVGKNKDCNSIPVNGDIFDAIWDETKPEIQTCYQEDQIVEIGDIIPNYIDEGLVIFNDNCDSDLEYDQNPTPGTIISQTTTPVTLTVTDDTGNVSEACIFDLVVEEEETYEFECIRELTVSIGEEAQNSSVTEIPTSDFITSDISNLDLELRLQQFTCEDIGTNPLIIRATDRETREKYSCTVNVTVKDVGAPLIICPAEAQTREIPANGVYVLPEVVELFGISDNCAADEELVIVQDPPPGTEFTEEGDYEIILTATDPYDNTETCEVTYRLTKSSDTVAPEISCPENISVENDTGVCGAVINFQDAIATDDSGGEVTIQRTDNIDLISGNVFPVGTYTISYTATDESNNVADCSFAIEVIDSQAPVLECKPSYELSFPRGETRILAPEELLNSFRDNCEGQDISLSLDRSQFTEEDDGQTINVTVTAFDSKNNFTSCIVPVSIVVVEEDELVLSCIDEYLIKADENCNYRVPDFSEILNYSPANASITQSIEAGSIIQAETSIEVTASFENQIQSCTIALNFEDDISPTISCPGDQVLNIAEGGVAARVPDFSDQIDANDNCGITEVIQDPLPGTEITTDTNISISVLDAAGNRASCDFEVQLMTGDELMISCPADKILEWDENCSFTLPDYTGEAEVFNGNGLEVIQDPLPGTLITDSEFEVTLRVEDGSDSDSCSFKISLEDNTPPVLQLNDVSRNLNGEGIASISFEDIDNGSFDSCDPDVTYTLNKSVFSCKELGTNVLQVTAEDSSGNTSSGTVTVSITDEFDFCEAPPTQGSEYIFIYPNPNTGSFKVATPADVTIQRLEVFDHRGRFIAAKDYEENVSEYALELGPLQEAVYVVKIITNKETLHKRFIFKY